MSVEEIIALQDKFIQLIGLVGMSEEMTEAVKIAIDFYQENIDKEK